MIINSIIAGAGGGTSAFHQTGTLEYHTGNSQLNISIPCSDTSHDYYLIKGVAKKSWKKVDGVWTEQSTLDFTGTVSSQQWLCTAFAIWFPSFTSSSGKNSSGNGLTTGEIRALGGRSNIYGGASSNYTFGNCLTGGISKGTSAFTGTFASNFNLCCANAGQTFEYEIWGWDA